MEIHAGESPLSGKLALVLPPGTWGVCTSSGTTGHSLSMGRADALTVVCRDPALADAWATALANQVSSPGDLERILGQVADIPEIVACVIIVGDRVGARGSFELKAIS
jgi:ApbE superfamily uncharacterized protein (UPF0280 family)